ncbi:hypothetical protein FRX31_026316, partial [Thalictrum thalictroides]
GSKMGASLSTEEGMTADERTEWERATDQKRMITDRAAHRILYGAPMILAVYVITAMLGNIPCSATTTMTVLPLFLLLAGAFMVMTFSQAFFSLKEIGEWMARERVKRASKNGVETQDLSFVRFPPISYNGNLQYTLQKKYNLINKKSE